MLSTELNEVVRYVVEAFYLQLIGVGRFMSTDLPFVSQLLATALRRCLLTPPFCDNFNGFLAAWPCAVAAVTGSGHADDRA